VVIVKKTLKEFAYRLWTGHMDAQPCKKTSQEDVC